MKTLFLLLGIAIFLGLFVINPLFAVIIAIGVLLLLIVLKVIGLSFKGLGKAFGSKKILALTMLLLTGACSLSGGSIKYKNMAQFRDVMIAYRDNPVSFVDTYKGETLVIASIQIAHIDEDFAIFTTMSSGDYAYEYPDKYYTISRMRNKEETNLLSKTNRFVMECKIMKPKVNVRKLVRESGIYGVNITDFVLNDCYILPENDGYFANDTKRLEYSNKLRRDI